MLPITREPAMLECKVNNFKVLFQLDSGSDVTTIKHCDAVAVGAAITPTSNRVLGYSGDPISLVGQCTLKVSYKGLDVQQKFLVVKSNSVNLLGRDLCTKLNINILLPDDVSLVHSVSDNVLGQFRDYLSDDFQSQVKQTVHLQVLSDSPPVFCKARTVPVRMRDSVKKELERLQAAGKITKVFASDWASPTVNVCKADGSVRICGDFSVSVNKYLQPVQSPLPTIDEVITQVGTAKIFAVIDLANAFLQLPLDEESKKYTTVNTTDGLFQYNNLPFGLRSSPGIFQAYMSKLLNGINNVIVYQDDLLIFSMNKHQHNDTLHKVLTTLRDAGIKLNTRKCKFVTKQVQYLGHIFNEHGVQPNPEKIRAILDAPSPTNVKQVQAFLGLCTFYSRFVPNFSDVMSPLYHLLKKCVKFHWGPDQQKCFQLIKQLFKSNKILKLYNASHETLLETDSSGYGIAAVLFQRSNSTEPWSPVQFASRSLNDAERNYSNIEREALSVVFGCEKFKKFLLGARFTIRNDQQPLRKLFGLKSGVPTTCSARIQRWALKLSQFHYDFEYSRGKDNVHSDCLSRLPLADTIAESEPYELVFTMSSLDNSPVTCEHVKHHTNLDVDLTELKQYIKYGFPAKITNNNLKPFRNLVSQLSLMKGCILFQNRVVIPQTLQQLVLNQMHEGHPGITAMKSQARSLIWYPNMDRDITELVKACPSCQSIRSRPPQNNNIEWPIPPRPWSRVHIDHFFFENKTCFIAVDALSKYIECETVPNTSVNATIDVLRTIFSRNGLCDVIVSDNASCFTAQAFKEFLINNGIQHITPPPYSPSSNGQAERGVRVVKDLLKKQNKADSFQTRLAKALFHYRCVPHSVTQIVPSVALNNRKYITVKDRVNPKYFFSKNRESESHHIVQFEIGDRVLALNVREGPKWHQATVVQKLGVNVYNVHIHQLNVVWKRHANQLLSITPVVNTHPGNNVAMQPHDQTCAQQPPLSERAEPVCRRSSRIRTPVTRFGFE